MKYCLDFQGKQLSMFDNCREINIDVLKTKLDNLKEYCDNHVGQRINLCINDYNEAIDKNKIYTALDFQKEHPEYQIKIRLPKWDELYYKDIKAAYPESSLYFNDYINNWDLLYEYLDRDVSDVFIIEQLGFEIDKVAEIVHAKNIQVRAFPNVAQSSYENLDDIYKFWIRPEDVWLYEDYIDVFEFYGDKDKQPIYYDIYTVDKKWMGDLKEIIIGLRNSLDSTCLVPRFGIKRVYCGRKCLKGDPCRICHHVCKLSTSIQKSGLRVVEGDFNNGKRTNSESGNTEENIK